MNPESFFGELRRRNVYKVAVAYAIVGWLLIQVATQVFPFLEIPNWIIRLVIALVAIGFPIALVIAWAFELTPEGIKRTEDVNLAEKRKRSHTWIIVRTSMHSLRIPQDLPVLGPAPRRSALRKNRRFARAKRTAQVEEG
jgi:hypothetical protein